jgi:hypothetical protein
MINKRGDEFFSSNSGLKMHKKSSSLNCGVDKIQHLAGLIPRFWLSEPWCVPRRVASHSHALQVWPITGTTLVFGAEAKKPRGRISGAGTIAPKWITG